jgi:hypothetical protein
MLMTECIDHTFACARTAENRHTVRQSGTEAEPGAVRRIERGQRPLRRKRQKIEKRAITRFIETAKFDRAATRIPSLIGVM